jgi:hypothetical protein
MGIDLRVCLSLLVAVCFATTLPTSASALTSSEVDCRATLAKSLASYDKALSKVITKCHKRRSAGQIPLSTNCNDPDQADPEIAEKRSQTQEIMVEACAGQTALLASDYVGCPAPAATADNGGATGGIDDFDEVALCLTALAEAHASQLHDDAEGSPDEELLAPLRKCQGKLGKGVSKVVSTFLRERRSCQQDADANGGDGGYDCAGMDPRGRIVRARLKFVDSAQKACNYSPEVIQKLDGCGMDAAGQIICSDASSASHGNALSEAAYQLDGGTSTSTTTTTMEGATTTTAEPTTTTTLEEEACGDSSAPECGGACTVGDVCVNQLGTCACVPEADGPCAPATIIRTIHSKYLPSGTSLSTGWSGSAHDVDIPDATGDTVDVVCDDQCENCDISMNVQAGDPTSNCRCTADPTQTCTAINGSDAASCGSLDPTCRCYFGSPLPLSSGGTPACVVNRIRQDYDGTMNLRTGEWNDEIRLAAVVYLGLSTTAPCPVCNGDPTPNDGVRGGTCSGGLGSGECDTNGTHPTFGATSWDCLPASAANISGAGLLINLNSTTESTTMPANVPCDTPGGADCHCRVCTGNGNLACNSNAECAAADAGVCTAGGGAGVVLNQCDGFACSASGTCTTGPVDSYCDDTVHPDGRGFIPCASNSDCSAGTCSVLDIRRCFPDPIVRTGDPDRYEPLNVATFCIAPTSNFAINLAAGLPGPGSLDLAFNSDIRCKTDPNLIYEFPAGANCPGGTGTTTTTLLPLPTCAESEAPVCGGVCPLGQVCTDNAGTCECTGLPLPECVSATAPTCGGFCPNLTDVCSDVGGLCECMPVTLPQCTDADAPVCGGLCPTGELCQDVGGTCECGAPGLTPCANSLSPVCGGVCDVGEICIDMSGACGCQSLGLPTCAEATSPGCLGTCALGSLCEDVSGACQCVGVPLP